MNEILKKYDEKMDKSEKVLRENFSAVRAGRANPAVLDKILVDYYGTPTKVNAIAAISVQDARVLVVQPWDRSALKAIEKAILTSDLGINPSNDGSVIRIPFPPLTEERRKELKKDIAKMGEECKVSLRNIRRDCMDELKALKKSGELTEDDQKDLEKQLQKLVDKHTASVDETTKNKEKEIMEI